MAIADDFAVAANGNITYTGAAHGAAGAGYYSVIEFHRWLSDIADDAVAATANDLVDITTDTPSDRKTDNYVVLINGYNIDQTASEHLFDGSIEQLGGNEIFDGLVVIAGEGMDLQIVQDGALLTNDFWNSIPNGETEKGLNRDVANGISHRFMLKVKNAGADIDGRRIVTFTRVDFTTKPASKTRGQTYSEFRINGTARGNNVSALNYTDDLNDDADASGFNTITNTEGYREIDVNANGTPEPYYSEWNRDIYSINQLYQRIKYLSRADSGNVGTLYGIDAKIFRGITHQVDGAQGGGGVPPFNASGASQPEPVSWSTGAGQLLAVDDTTAATQMWIQLLTGIAPVNTDVITGGTTGATFTASSSTERPISTPFIGVSTGSALIGAYGLGVEALDLGPSDTVFDLGNNATSAPNNVTFTVGGVTNAEDRILVGPSTGATALDNGQFVLDSGITSGAASITVTTGTETPGTGSNSEDDTPNAGTIRVLDNNGVYQRVTYTGYTVGAGTMTFTGCSGAPTANVSNNVFVSYVDALYNGTAATQSYTATYSGANRTLFVRVRDGGTAGDTQGIKTFETEAVFGNADSSVTAIRTPDV